MKETVQSRMEGNSSQPAVRRSRLASAPGWGAGDAQNAIVAGARGAAGFGPSRAARRIPARGFS
ncbi:hypothetical protein DWV00_10950 [Trinickia dinghuensis]|uniref:Uncharacterized protein n=1 Tax=Trinickia dinghuensis TaxID=2291023 RepID=A0A3D8K0G0_9BURK|nr:hypothetical protein DWV00_10950 [Trinickia dinghuensis]